MAFWIQLTVAAIAEAVVLLTLERRAERAPALRRASMFVGAVMAGILGGGIGAAAGGGPKVVIAVGVMFAVQVFFAFRAAERAEPHPNCRDLGPLFGPKSRRFVVI